MSAESSDFAQLRRAMVDNQLRTFNVMDRAVLARMLSVPREQFVPGDKSAIAYSDTAIEVNAGSARRRMLPPMILARMIQTAAIDAGDRVLDVGGATGYSAAVLAGLGAEVVAVETDEALSRAATANLAKAAVSNVRAVSGPLEAGFAAGAPYDVIIVNGMIEKAPAALLGQLADGGRLIAIRRVANDPTGRAGKAVKYEKSGQAIGAKEVFDASADILQGFRAEPAFAF